MCKGVMEYHKRYLIDNEEFRSTAVRFCPADFYIIGNFDEISH